MNIETKLNQTSFKNICVIIKNSTYITTVILFYLSHQAARMVNMKWEMNVIIE